MVFPTPSIGNTLAILYLTSPWPGLLSLRSSFHFVLGFLHLPIHTVLSMQLRRVCRLHYWMLKNRWYVVPPWFCFDLSHVSMRDIWFIINFGMRLTDYNAANIYKSGWYFLFHSHWCGLRFLVDLTVFLVNLLTRFTVPTSQCISQHFKFLTVLTALHESNCISQFLVHLSQLLMRLKASNAPHSSWCISHSC